MSRPAQWALSPLDLQAHLLLDEGCHPKGVLKARCGHLLPPRAMRFAEVSARKCPDCHLMSLSDAILSLRVDDTDAAPSGRRRDDVEELVSAVHPEPGHPPGPRLPLPGAHPVRTTIQRLRKGTDRRTH